MTATGALAIVSAGAEQDWIKRIEGKQQAETPGHDRLVAQGMVGRRTPDLPAPLLQKLLRLFETAIDAILTTAFVAVGDGWRRQAATLCGQPRQHMRHPLGAQPRSRLDPGQAELGNILRLEVVPIQQAAQGIDFAAIEFQGKLPVQPG